MQTRTTHRVLRNLNLRVRVFQEFGERGGETRPLPVGVIPIFERLRRIKAEDLHVNESRQDIVASGRGR